MSIIMYMTVTGTYTGQNLKSMRVWMFSGLGFPWWVGCGAYVRWWGVLALPLASQIMIMCPQ